VKTQQKCILTVITFLGQWLEKHLSHRFLSWPFQPAIQNHPRRMLKIAHWAQSQSSYQRVMDAIAEAMHIKNKR